jgi:DivIVA domain-containing protein
MAEESFDGPQEPRPARRPRKRSAADGVRGKEFPPAMRGYERSAVDAWREEVARLVERLEEQAPRDAAVKRALEEVGKETSAILQRAHEAADDIASRSRSQAEGRLQRAEREAEITVAEAEARVAQLDADYRSIWDERQRLLEEMRQLADDVLGVADDASDRISGPAEPEPEGGPSDEAAAAEEAELSTEENPAVTTGEEAEIDEPGARPTPVTPATTSQAQDRPTVESPVPGVPGPRASGNAKP